MKQNFYKRVLSKLGISRLGQRTSAYVDSMTCDVYVKENNQVSQHQLRRLPEVSQISSFVMLSTCSCFYPFKEINKFGCSQAQAIQSGFTGRRPKTSRIRFLRDHVKGNMGQCYRFLFRGQGQAHEMRANQAYQISPFGTLTIDVHE